MTDLLIRTACPDDAVPLLDLYAHYVRNTAVTFEYDVPSPEDFRVRIVKTLQKYPFLAAERDGRLLGYAYAGPFVGRAAYDWAAEVTVYLAPDARGQGLGRALYQRLEQDLKCMGIRNLYACIGYPDPEDEYLTRDSARFHARMGYEQVGFFRQCGCKFDRWYHMIWMEKLIGEHTPGPDPVRPFPHVCQNNNTKEN